MLEQVLDISTSATATRCSTLSSPHVLIAKMSPTLTRSKSTSFHTPSVHNIHCLPRTDGKYSSETARARTSRSNSE